MLRTIEVEIDRDGRIHPLESLPPARLLADVGRDDWIACRITGNPYSDPVAMDVVAGDFAAGGLPCVSHLRPGMLFTAHRSTP